MKLTSVSPCQNIEEISGLPTNQLHSPNPEGENTEPSPIIESNSTTSIQSIFSHTLHAQQFQLFDHVDDQAN